MSRARNRPDTTTVTVRRVEPKPRPEKKPLVTRTPWTGTLGPIVDLWVLAQAGCHEPQHLGGHAPWTPPEELQRLFRAESDRYDPDVDPGVPFHPKCRKCRQAGKRILTRRGLDRETAKRRFERIGAKWDWASRETDRKRREDDSGVMVVDQRGQLTTDKNLAAQQRRKAREAEKRAQNQANLERRAKEQANRRMA